MMIEDVARVAHEVNRAYQQAMGDEVAPFWEHASPELRESVEAGVRALLADPSLTPERLHQRWLDRKLMYGWQYGPVKDEARKLHPCVLTYWALTEEQQTKYHLFRGVVLALAKFVPRFAYDPSAQQPESYASVHPQESV